MSKKHEKPAARFCWWCGQGLWGGYVHRKVIVDGLPRIMHKYCADHLPYPKIHVMRPCSNFPGMELDHIEYSTIENSAVHETDSEQCWCEPEIEEQADGSALVIHRTKEEAN